MMDLLRIFGAFALIVLLLRLRWNFGGVMLLAAVFLGSLYNIGPAEQIAVFGKSGIDPVTLNLLIGLVLIMAMENIIRKRGLLRQMTESLSRIVRDRRVSMAILPSVIGLLPSAGGAAFSAPLVQEAAGGIEVSPERRAFINYWFRHIWEYFSPLYPGIVLAAAVSHIPINRLMLSQLPLPLAFIAAGAFLCFRGVAPSRVPGIASRKDVIDLSLSLMPIVAAVVLVAGIGLSLSVAMALIVIVLLVVYQYSWKETGIALKESISLNVITMVLGVMVFKSMLGATGAIESLPRFFRESGMPPVAVYFALPFIVGLLTGITVAFVGSTFPLIVAMNSGHPDPAIITFAYAAGFAGVLLSPTHLCLLLTVRYFKADLAGTYRLMYLPIVMVLLVGLVVLLAS